MRIVKFTFLIVFVVMSIICSGCASILSKSSYPVNIKSRPDEAGITVYNKKGVEVFSGKTPSTVTLKANEGFFSGEEYTIKFQKNSYQPYEAKLAADIDGWYLFGNILVGGLIGWLIVDPISGAMWQLDDVSAILLKKRASENSEMHILNIVLLEDVPEIYRFKLKRIN